GLKNIVTILADAADSQLPPNTVDLVFTSNAYHHLSNRVEYFRGVSRWLSSNGRVAIIDSDGTGWFNKIFGHWTPGDAIENEMNAAGYRLVQRYAIVDGQHFLMFERVPAEVRS